MEVPNMKPKSSRLALIGLTILGSLGIGVNSASAQSVYVDPYVAPYPVVESYPVVVAPRYVVPPAVVAPRPIVRERIVTIDRGPVVTAPLIGPPVPAPYIVADW